MTPQQLEEFLTRHDLSNQNLADILGVTGPAVDHWLAGRREIPETTIRLLLWFDENPKVMLEWEILMRERGRD